MRSAKTSFVVFLLQYSKLLLLPTLPICKCEEETTSVLDTNNNVVRGGTNIAIIGGGIGGSFATKFLSDFDTKDKACRIDSIVLFDPSPILQPEETMHKSAKTVPTSGVLENNWQGGRVTSITLDDGTVAELGGSVVFDGNRLVLEIMEGDPSLKRTSAGTKSKKKKDDMEKNMPQGFGVYDGQGKWKFLSSGSSSFMRKIKLLWRYNIDLIRISRAATRSLPPFYSIYDMLKSNDPATFFKSIDELWNATGYSFYEYSRVSFDVFLDTLGMKRDLPWWRKLIPGQGSFRMELSTAMNLCNNNQPNSQMNGLSGFTNYMSTTGHIFSIEGGNYQLIQSALRQAKAQYDNASCDHDSSDVNKRISHVQKKVTTVVSDSEQMELWSGDESLGRFDIVILAAPLQFSQISFFTKSNLDDDEEVDLQPMFNLNDSENMSSDGNHEISPLPPSTGMQYTQVVTTVVSNATIQSKYFGLAERNMPKSIYVTERGREIEGITALSCIGVNGAYKIFSPEKLSGEHLNSFFGPNHKVEYVKVWGGNHGGATPNYDGGGGSAVTTPFLLYDGTQKGENGKTKIGPALFYINSVEPTVAVIELSAIGAKSVAKLVAQRLGLLTASPSKLMDEEL